MESFVKSDENIFRSRSRLPRNFWFGHAGHGFLRHRPFMPGVLASAAPGVPGMIPFEDLALESGDMLSRPLSLEIADGEIYFLLNRLQANDLLFQVPGRPAAGRRRRNPFRWRPGRERERAKARFSSTASPMWPISRPRPASADWIDFLCSACGLDRESIFKTLLVCNFHERQLKKMVRDLAPEIFKQVYLAVCLAGDSPNIVINDFIRGAEKSFELKFNKLLLQKKAAGRAILYLGSDIFYASEIADRVGFIKNGRLLFEADGRRFERDGHQGPLPEVPQLIRGIHFFLMRRSAIFRYREEREMPRIFAAWAYL